MLFLGLQGAGFRDKTGSWILDMVTLRCPRVDVSCG